MIFIFFSTKVYDSFHLYTSVPIYTIYFQVYHELTRVSLRHQDSEYLTQSKKSYEEALNSIPFGEVPPGYEGKSGSAVGQAVMLGSGAEVCFLYTLVLQYSGCLLICVLMVNAVVCCGWMGSCITSQVVKFVPGQVLWLAVGVLLQGKV